MEARPFQITDVEIQSSKLVLSVLITATCFLVSYNYFMYPVSRVSEIGLPMTIFQIFLLLVSRLKLGTFHL